MHAFLNFIHGLAARAQALAESMGGPGLFVVAFVDSSFLTLPEVADILVVLFAIRSPADWPYFVAMTTAGSVTGSYVLYLVGRKGGEAILKRRFHERHVDRFLGWYRRFGAWVLVVPATLPPPTPFKLFVLVAGVAGVNRRGFLAAVTIGRGVRYGVEAYLATLYGEQALRFVKENAFRWAVPAIVVLVTLMTVWLMWRRLARRRATAARPGPPANVE